MNNDPEGKSPQLSSDVLEQAAKLQVYDDQGNAVAFGTLYQDQKTIVVFIRHFFCGSCQQYVIQLATVSPHTLAQANTRLVIIGCGDWHLIKNYRETTGYSGALYADHSRALYHLLALTTSLALTLAGQEKRGYLAGRSFVANVVKSIWDGPLKNPQHIGKQGDISQLGGDFILGPGNVCAFASRMQHTEDHVDVPELMREAGVVYP
ncbi:hypothetical protein WOLCODRAFT_160820 [Wolfiporia cocos MD-104 SS10]|uniref:Thioredoxin-like protein AAED1 n=1 Tax=Wolfiporia cocos (strain MD-104) TaxID=742152 RepID=A0A2H3J6J4_WOLCO|nr:hypothetical protein WOLCODRAFT_160820 [Wolfiporia cocos MD-104 SS10]